ncbi:transposable element Tc3 transposase [Trichonephila clavipes]|nr:transposable element Tc3 transposase [Trichonephila clavipes]
MWSNGTSWYATPLSCRKQLSTPVVDSTKRILWKIRSIQAAACVLKREKVHRAFNVEFFIEEIKSRTAIWDAMLDKTGLVKAVKFEGQKAITEHCEANPQVYVETPLHPEKLFGALFGLVESFKNDEGQHVTVNGDQYRAMITNFFIPELNNHDVQELWFQQDSATCHTARATIHLLKDTFGNRLISRFGPVNRPPRSCDLTPLDYFLWGYVKSLVYVDKPQTLDYLEDNIRRVIADIRPQMLGKVIENWTSRLDYIRASRGGPMPEIILKM